MKLTITPQTKALIVSAKALASQIPDNLVITNAEEMVWADNERKMIKERAATLNETRLTATRPMDEAKKVIMDWFREPIDMLTRKEGIIVTAMRKFRDEQDRKRRAEEARLAEEARKRAEDERKKLEAAAKKAEKKGDEEKADELREQKAAVVELTPVIPDMMPKVDGRVLKKTWKAKIVNFAKLPDEYKLPNERLLGEVARNTRGTKEIPGVEYYEE
ncbi:MAG TPA: hypothetical protein P5110_07445 [Candidatus Omnitrophota bacterium]|nr:hypothetical protein [Candidatus Omnitrophota bacterium]